MDHVDVLRPRGLAVNVPSGRSARDPHAAATGKVFFVGRRAAPCRLGARPALEFVRSSVEQR
jgi:hypothetical protein